MNHHQTPCLTANELSFIRSVWVGIIWKSIFYVGRFDSNGKVIEEMVNETDKVRELPGFFQVNKPSTLLQSSTHSSNNPTPTVPPEAQPNLGELQESTKGEVVPDVVTMTNSIARMSLTECLQKRQVIDFIKPRCSDLLTEHVLNNQSFITAMAFPLAKIKEFIACEEKYSSKQAKKSSTTDLSKIIEKIKGQIKNLDEKCKETCQIKVDISFGTERLCVASSQKQMMLTQVATMALEIRHIIETSSVLPKLKK